MIGIKLRIVREIESGVVSIRDAARMCQAGVKKIHRKLKDKCIAIGRDALFEMLKRKDMLVKRKRKATQTTYSKHSYAVAPNRIKSLSVTKPLQVLVGDITYLRLASGQFAYLYLLSDLYSRKVVGYHVSRDLTHHSALVALGRAVDAVGRDAITGAIPIAIRNFVFSGSSLWSYFEVTIEANRKRY